MLGGHEFKSKEEGKPLETEISFHWLTSRASRPFSNKRKLRVLCVHWELLEMGHYFEVLQGNVWIIMMILFWLATVVITSIIVSRLSLLSIDLKSAYYSKMRGVTMQRHFLSFTGSFENSRHILSFFQRLFFLYQLAVFIYICHGLAASFVLLF